MATEEISIDLLARELHRAIESGSFEFVPELAKDYSQAVAEALYRTKSSQARTEIAEQACSFLQDHLHLARVMRAHISAQTAQACRLASYRSYPSIESTWYVSG